MIRLRARGPLTAGLALLATTTLLAACGGADSTAPAGSPSGSAAATTPTTDGTATSHPEPRIVVANPDRVEVRDAEDLSPIASFDVATTPYVALGPDDRHVFTLEHQEKQVQIVDSGTWTDAHGDHGHSYVTEPSRLDLTLKGTSYHAVSGDGRTVVWNDDAGSFAVVTAEDLADGSVTPKVIELKDPHHGVAVPWSKGGYLASFSDDGEAAGIIALDPDGTETDRYEGCPHLHGETHLGEDAYAFGCADGIMVIDSSGARKIAAPVDDAGTGHLVGDGESPVLAGTLSSESRDDLATKIALYDTAKGKSKVVDLGVEFSRLAAADGQAVVVGTDGNLHVVDLATGKVRTVKATKAWTKPKEFLDPRPQLALVGDRAWVTDPMSKQIIVVDLTTGKKVTSAEVDGQPDQIVVANAGAEEHDHE